jgi:hypothetical protein
MALFWTNLTNAFARASPPRVFRRNAGTGHCWAEGVAFMRHLAFGTQMQPYFYLEMRAVAEMYMRSETYSAASYGFIYPRFVFSRISVVSTLIRTIDSVLKSHGP